MDNHLVIPDIIPFGQLDDPVQDQCIPEELSFNHLNVLILSLFVSQHPL